MDDAGVTGSVNEANSKQERCTSCMCPLSHSTAQRLPEASFWFSDISLHTKLRGCKFHARNVRMLSFFLSCYE